MLSPGVWVAIVVLAVLIAAGIVAKAYESGSAPSKPTASPAAFVIQSAHRTLAQSTAKMTLSGTIQMDGQSLPLTGTGEIDFGTGATQLSLHSSLSGHPLAVEEVLVSGNLYVTMTVAGVSLSQMTGGHGWIELPVDQSSSTTLNNSDPTSPLAVLEQPGIAVQELGSATIDGVVCNGYSVTPTRQAILAAASQEAARLGLPPAVTSQFSSVVASEPIPTYRVWFDAQGLLRQMDMSLQTTAVGTISATATVDFSDYGSPVQITAPASSEVIPLSSLLRTLGKSNGLCLAQC